MSNNEVTRLMHNAIQLDTAGQLKEAEECYTQAIYYLRQSLSDPALSQNERNTIMSYMSDVAKRIQRIRAVESMPKPKRTHAAPPQQPTTTGAASPKHHTAGASAAAAPKGASKEDPDDYLSFLGLPKTPLPSPSVPAKNTTSTPASPPPAAAASPVSSPTPPPAKPDPTLDMPPVPSTFLAAPNVDKDPASAPVTLRNEDIPAPPRDMSTNHGIDQHFAPRTSGLVLKAIDVATQLNKRGEVKRAVDVLQHAYMMGSRERNNPANFKEVKETLRLMRKRYYTVYQPRFLQDNPILPAEMDVLRRSGVTSTLLLPMWDDVDEGYGAENVFMPSEDVWEDQFTPLLNDKQKTNGAKLVHVGDLARAGKEPFTIIRQADPLNIKQTVVGDCSLVCSLIICAAYQKKYPNAKIISNVIYPQDLNRNPIVNPKGKYCVKMLINGMTRIVTIDDRLPANPRSKELLCTYSRDPTELWVSLMEKAFVKICGGSYNFPGSSSSSDLYKLCGWLPDITKFDDKDFDGEFEWGRMVRNFNRGAVLLTITTPDDGVVDLKGVLLGAQHCYAVLDLRELEGRRVLFVQNPWSKLSWSGPLSHTDKSADAVKIREAFGLTEEMTNRGVFCISWEDTLRYFDRCFLSWNPYLLYPTPDGLSKRPTRLACHGTFPYTLSVGQMPQLHIGVVKAPRRHRMHLVFSRHVSNVTEFGLQSDKDDNTLPYVALKVYDISEYPSIAQSIGGSCVFGMCYCRRLASASDISVRMQPLNSVTYRKATSWLTSFDCPAGTSNLLVLVTRLGSPVKEPFNFSVTLHSELEQMRLPMLKKADAAAATTAAAAAEGSLMENANMTAGNPNAGVYMHLIPKTCLRCMTTVPGAFVKGKSCGGRTDGNTYVYNPQYVLTLSKPSMVAVRLSVPECDETTQVHLVLKRPPKEERAKTAKIPFALRVGNTNSDVSFVMRSRVYSYGGAVLDSALPHTLDYDGGKLLGDRQVDETKKAQMQLLSSVPGRATSFNLYDLDDDDEVTVLLLAAVDKGHIVSPTLSKVMIDKQPLPQGTPGWSMRLFQGASGAAPLVAAGKNKFEVQIGLGTDAVSFTPKTKGGDLWDDMRSLCRDVRNCSSQLSSYVTQIVNLHRKAKTLPDAQANYLTELCMFIADYVKRVADGPRAPPQPVRCLPPLPAGEYTIIPSLWEKGVPANYELVVETTEAHTIQPLPEEGEGWNQTTISGQLLSGGYLTSTTAPVHLQKADAVFQNSKVNVSFVSKGLFMCRLFVVGGDSEAEQEKSYVNVSLFVESNQATMQMVASSGSYSASGVAVPITAVDRQCLLVVSAHPPCKNKYVLRLFSDVGMTAALTA